MTAAKRSIDMTGAGITRDKTTRADMTRESRARFWRPVPFALGVAALLGVRRGADVNVAAPSASAALSELLASRGYACAADDVAWTVGARGIAGALTGGARALVRASQCAHAPCGEAAGRAADRAAERANADPADLYLVEARLSPEGVLLEAGGIWNLTRTAAVDESRAIVRGHRAAYTTTADGLVTAVHTLDLAGRDSADLVDFNHTQRWQVALTNLQQTGQTSGVVHNAFALEPPARDVDVRWKDDATLLVKADDRAVVLDATRGEATSGADAVRATLEEKAKPGNVITWAVDRVRDMPWFGEEKMQWVKAIAFTGLDWVSAHFAKATTAQDVKNELGDLNAGQAAPVAFTDPEIGWPPAPIKPLLSPALPGEGQWIALDRDPFISKTANSGAASTAFITSFVRPNPRRPDLRVYVTLWDPRQIALHMESGTVEPVSATGERGPGLIPRTPEVMKRVVAAFNGGFQAQHGEFGMQANRILYLPPKPYGATVLEMKDGSTAFGTWPPNASKDAGVGGAPVPEGVLSFRQNLTPMVEFDRWNPWGRTWWGGTPPGWGDNIHTARSAVCLTKDNFVGYLWSASISPDDFGAALLAAGCSYGIHLDMNPGHAGFEFYNVMPSSEWKPLGRPMQTDWEADGKVPQMPDWQFRGRRMIRGMGHMNFPRYIQREGRDFFYLTSRPILPGAELPTAFDSKEPGEGAWRMKGLPQHGFPYALAITTVRPERTMPDLRVRVLRVDPRTVKPAGSAAAASDAPVVLSFAGAQAGHERDHERDRERDHDVATSLFYAAGNFAIAARAPSKDAALLASGVAGASASPRELAQARAVVGVHDEDGMLEWIELPPETPSSEPAAKAMLALLERDGCSARMLVAGASHPLLGGALDLATNPVAAPAPSSTTTARLVRGTAPGAHLLFEETELVPFSVWQPLQAQRVKGARRPAATNAGAQNSTAPNAAGGAPSVPSTGK